MGWGNPPQILEVEMSLLWIDGFEKYGPTGASASPSYVFHQKYNSNADEQHFDILSGSTGKGLKLGSSFTTPYLTTDPTIIIGFAFKTPGVDSDGWDVIFGLKDAYLDSGSNNFANASIIINSNGLTTNEISFLVETDVKATSNNVDIQLDTWYYLEAKIYKHSTNGTANIKIDGEEVVSFSGDTYSGSFDHYGMVYFTSENDRTFDDLYICDGSGSKNNDFLGTCNVKCLSPSSDASGNWTPSTGNDLYAVINEDELNSDYISSNTSNEQTLVELDNFTESNIKGIGITIDSKVTGNINKYTNLITQNGTGNIQEHSAVSPGLDMLMSSIRIMEENSDGDDWDSSTINSLRIGVEVA